PVHTRFHIFFIFYNSFLFNQKRRPSGTPVVALCCLFPAVMQGVGISDLPKEKMFPAPYCLFGW
ncbi:hypothetical protein, partial [Dorea sp. 210702-DFI.3.17]|uniref:hypothetical protein n=1 Tax=Dorea sp. 210702-DFI.3.17 TaxID=2883208 RepID=UPI001D07DB19